MCYEIPLMIRLGRRLMLSAAGLCLAAGCLSPTLPLPPPAAPEVTAPDASGMVRVTGVADTYAEVFVWNRNTDVIAGQVTRDSPSYSILIAASTDDTLQVWYIKGDDESPSVKVRVRGGPTPP